MRRRPHGTNGRGDPQDRHERSVRPSETSVRAAQKVCEARIVRTRGHARSSKDDHVWRNRKRKGEHPGSRRRNGERMSNRPLTRAPKRCRLETSFVRPRGRNKARQHRERTGHGSDHGSRRMQERARGGLKGSYARPEKSEPSKDGSFVRRRTNVNVSQEMGMKRTPPEHG